jgi:predicted ATPase/class 3 adenylate cyclase/tetratricopeptide (TPR) repeat protein
MSRTSALLMTDVVDSTSLSRHLGDAAMSLQWQAHDRLARDLVRHWHGREIDKSDGFLLLFPEARSAAGFAVDYHRALATMRVPMQARAGLHVGPVTLRENDPADILAGAKPLEVDGLVKPVAARIMQLAQGGQTLVTAEAAAALQDTPWRTQSHGHWRVKGIEHPIELFEIGDRDAPFTPPPDSDKVYRVVRNGGLWLPLHSLRHSLPAERDAFVGRRAALRDLARHFEAGARLVSIVGVGGIGKTRLAQRFGWTWLGDFPGGVWFCDLSQARSLDGITHSVAEGLGVPLGKADPLQQVGDALAGRAPCLVILDNFEQVTSHAEQTVGRWLDRAPKARFLVTSREILGIAGDEVVDIEPLTPKEAATLFVRRAEAARQDFRPTAVDQAAIDPLVKLLDGLPLAIELAAARVRVMPPRALLQRMSERFSVLVSGGGRRDRQATLRAAFDWSWDLLSAPERAALAQLSVFEGGFSVQAVEGTLDLAPHAGPLAPLDALQSLVEKSLVRRLSDDRFTLLTTVQEYAAEHLATPGRYEGSGPDAESAAQARHFCWFGRAPATGTPFDPCIDVDNAVVACRRAARRGEGAAAVGALQNAWAAVKLRGPFRLGVELSEAVRAVPGLDASLGARADWISGEALKSSGRGKEAQARLASALAAARSLRDRGCEGRVLGHLAAMHINEGRMDDARSELMDQLAIARVEGDLIMECEAHTGLGTLHEHLGRMTDARMHYESALGVARAAGHRRWEGGSLGNLGLLYANQGRMAEAKVCYEAAIAIASELGDLQWEGNTRCNLGLLHHTQGRLGDAREQLDESLRIARELGHPRLECFVQGNLGIVCESGRAPDEARAHYEAAVHIARDLRDKRTEGQFLAYLGALHGRQGRFAEGRSCLDDAERLLGEVSDRLSLALMLCGRAELECLAGDDRTAASRLDSAATVAAEVGAEPESELGLALARVAAMVRAPDRARR